MPHMTNLSVEQRLLVSAALIVSLGGCGEERSVDTSPPTADAAQPEEIVDAGATRKSKRVRPEYDEEGVPIPSKAQALGVALPRGFERLGQDRGSVTYGGKIPARKLHDFYQRYLDCLEVHQVKKGWRFVNASPRPPGDTSRSVDVTVLDGRGQSSLVVVIDRMSRSKLPAPDAGVKTHEELFKAAHGVVSPTQRPIPGTH